jgi:cell division protein FtsQ
VRLDLSRIVPSTRSLLAAAAIAAVSVGGYFVARDTPVFAVSTIDVRGARPAVALQIQRALAADRGASLLKLDLERARETVAAVPTVAAVTLDRAFPHTLRVIVVPERPVAVVRQGAGSWLVSARGRIMTALVLHARPGLPRIWIPKGPLLTVGGMGPIELHEPLAAVAPLHAAHFAARVTSVRVASDELTLILRSGLELRLGNATDVRLKLAVAARVLPRVGAGTRYVDVSVPERPVAGSIVQRPDPGATENSANSESSSQGSAATATLNSKVEVDGAGVIGP